MHSDADYSSYVIFLKAREGSVFKNLVEFCYASLDVLVFRVSSKGLTMSADNRKEDKKESLMCTLNMPRENFEVWEIPPEIDDDPEQEFILPVDASNLRNLTSGILKKDVLLLSIKRDDVDVLWLEVQNLEKERRSVGNVRLIAKESLSKEQLDPVLPCEYNLSRPNATVLATEFQKACKAGTQLKAESIRVSAQDKCVTFHVANAEVSRTFPFGTESGNKPNIYDQDFLVKNNIGAIPKCCPMTTNVRIYCSDKKPMLISFDASKSGKFDVYLVSKQKVL